LTVVLAPHFLAVKPAGPHLNGTKGAKVDSNGEDFHAFPASTVGLLVECRAVYCSAAKGTTIE
jgi:hypothetical protein